jgi:Uma2 family endonuclease
MEGGAMAQPMGGRAKLTFEDFLLFPDDGKQHELIDGEHFVTPAPHLRHQRVSQNLFVLLHAHVRENGLGQVFYAPVDVVLTPFDVVEPDLLFVATGRLAILGANVEGAPDLVVEILSPSTRRRDEVLKRDLYDFGGVREYWLVDIEAASIKAYRREGERFARPQVLTAADGDALRSPLLPGLEIALSQVFAS